MNRDRALEKIKACLRLSKSSNEHEAAAALRQAQALMREHGVSITDVQLSDVVEHRARARSATVNRWEAALAHLVADAFGCRWFSLIHRTIGLARDTKTRHVIFVGVGRAAEIACYSYEVLQRQCLRARSAHIAAQPASCKRITKTARGDAFAFGWVAAVGELIDAFAGNDTERLLIEQYMGVKHPNLGSSKPRDTAVGRNVRADDFAAGVRAGKAARLDRGIGAAEEPKKLASEGAT